MRGYASNLGDGEYFSVLIELGETEDLLRRRLAVRYSLTARQGNLLMLMRRGADRLQMASLLEVSPSSLKASLRELRLKLDLPDLAALRRFAAVLGSDVRLA